MNENLLLTTLTCNVSNNDVHEKDTDETNKTCDDSYVYDS